ncbi:MAG: hypothetical protein ACOX4K_00165 [Bacillota bacterium]
MNKEIQNEQELEEVAEDKNGIVTWVKAHKKQLVLIGISVPTLIAIVLGLKNKDAIKELFDNLKDEIEKANLYSGNWFEECNRCRT